MVFTLENCTALIASPVSQNTSTFYPTLKFCRSTWGLISPLHEDPKRYTPRVQEILY